MDINIRGGKAYAYTGGTTFDVQLPTVVFVHGGAHDHSVGILQSRYLAHHGYSVLAPDLPGHGRSQGAPLERVEDMADWVAALIDSVGAKHTILVGHSMGSLIALECAARYPDRVAAIALLGPAFPMRVSAELLAATKDDEAAAPHLDMTKSKVAPKTPLKGHSELQALWEAVQTAGPPVPTELRLLWEAASPREAAAKEPAPAATAAAREAETAMAFPPDLQALWDAAVKLQELQELHHKGEQ